MATGMATATPPMPLRGTVDNSMPDTVRVSRLVQTAQSSDRRFGAGDATIVLVAISAFGADLIGRVADHATKVIDAEGSTQWVTTGNRGGEFAQALLVLAAAISIASISSRIRSTRLSVRSTLVVIFVLWWIAASLSHEGSSWKTVENIGLIAVFFGCMVFSPPTIRVLRALFFVYLAMLISCLGYGLVLPSTGSFECRADKCGVFGTLLTGYFPHENTFGMQIAAMLPVAAFSPSRGLRWITVGISLVSVAATGSRTGEAAWVLAFAAMLWLLGIRPRLLTWGIRRGPLVAMLVSTGVFLFADQQALTGRGLVYSVIRSHMTGMQLLTGPGEGVLQFATAVGSWGSFQFVTEHSQAANIAERAGAIGLFVFIIILVFRRRVVERQMIGLCFAFAVAIEMVTEAVWPLFVRDESFWSFLVFIGFSCGAVRGAEASQLETMSREA